ncbi:MAG: Crp/Fnr family transcriptional regulator [Bacteroidota bacterium]
MSDVLRTYLAEKNVFLTEAQFTRWTSAFVSKKVKKHELLLKEGDVARNTSFTKHGCLRMYTIDNKGKEHIMQFAPENWWLGDIESSSKHIPSVYFIDALEDSDLLIMDVKDWEKSINEIPPLAVLFQRLMQNRQTATQKRIIFSMSASAEERYLDFMKTYPSLAQRIPQHMIASYLGITPESLSRIRKQVVKSSK